jgi:hypothetical protein
LGAPLIGVTTSEVRRSEKVEQTPQGEPADVEMALGLKYVRAVEQAGGRPLLVLYTDDLDAVRRRLAEHDVDVWAERADDTGRSLHFRDVAGNVIVAAELT